MKPAQFYCEVTDFRLALRDTDIQNSNRTNDLPGLC